MPAAGDNGSESAGRDGRRHRLALCFYDIDEAAVSDAVSALTAGVADMVEAAVSSDYGEVRLELACTDADKAVAAGIAAELRQGFGRNIFSGGETVEQVVVRELGARSATLALAESCTGGLLAGTVTGVSGSSAVFRGAVVAYHNDVKVGLLGVRQDIIDRAGAVSEPVAQWMAVGARSRLNADYGVGITGIAGPGGGTPDKPVGLVYICVSSPGGDSVERFDFGGDRDQVRRAAVVAALHMLRRAMSA